MSTTPTAISSPPSSDQLDVAGKGSGVKVASFSAQSTPDRESSPHKQSEKRPQLRHKNSITENFTGPMDTEHHSKLPDFLRMHGSITPRMILPLTFIAAWSTLITALCQFVYPLVVNSLLLTVLGFVVGLGISFRTSSAYERYVDGRRFWAQLSQSSRDLARHIWTHVDERHAENPELGKADLLAKISALNLLAAFGVALKHRLRFEPYTDHDDLSPLVSHLQTFAGEATTPATVAQNSRKYSNWKQAGQHLGLTFAESNPRKQMKRATRNLGNLPVEILTYLSAYTASLTKNKTLDPGVPQAMILGNLASLNEVLAGTERVLNTPLPVAYSIAISQITWVYVLALPFQLWDSLRWITIPGTIIGAYIILGIAAIGREIENPFGNDVNDLPLEKFCKQIADEINVVMARPSPEADEFVKRDGNQILHGRSYDAWMQGNVQDIRDGLRVKALRPTEGDPSEKEHLRLRQRVMGHSNV